jgi:UDP-glucose 6-dehydrogenase
LFNPEFLSANKAISEFENPDRQLVGYTDKSFRYAMDVLNMLPIAPHEKIMPSTEAEICKYVNNFHGALMVIFANYFYDVCQASQADFESVRESSIASKYVGSSMGRTYWNVMQGGFRGYGGMCFPKDMNTLALWSKENKIKTRGLLDEMIKINRKLLEEQNLTEKDAQKL